MSYQLWLVYAGSAPGGDWSAAQIMRSGGLTAAAAQWGSSHLPPLGGTTSLALLGGADDHVLWFAGVAGQERSGLSEGADAALRGALVWWLAQVEHGHDRVALESALASSMGGLNLITLVADAVGLNPPDRRARLGEWAGPASFLSEAGETLVDWDAQRWQFGSLRRGYGVWDVTAPDAPVRRFPASLDGEAQQWEAMWELVMDPIVAATRLEGEIAACPVTPRLAGGTS